MQTDILNNRDGLFVDVGGGLLPYLGAAHASRAYRYTIDRMGLGASQTPPCHIKTANGEIVGRISYNGRVWQGAEWKEGDAPIYDPCSRDDLAAEYERCIGYNPFEDDPSITEDEVRQTLDEWAVAA